MEAFEPFDLVVVPFPFTDRNSAKRRPALVLSSRDFQADCGHLILCMVTTAKRSAWPGDVSITDWRAADLPQPSIVRPKLFTLDQRLILRRLGRLSAADEGAVRKALESVPYPVS